MKVFFWFCLLLLIPGLLLRIPVGGSGILATDLILPLFAAVWVGQKLIVDRRFPSCSFVRPGFAFALVALLSFLLGAGELLFKEQVLSFAYLIRFISILIFGWAAVDLFPPLEKGGARGGFFRHLFAITTTVILLGLIQFIFIPDISTWSTEGGWDPHTGRLLGTWMDPNFVAGFLGLMTPLLIGQWYRTDSKRQKAILSVLILLFLYALFLTFSRSGYLAALTGLGLFFLCRDPKVILIGILLATIGLATNERAQKRVGELAGTVSSIVLRETDEIDPTASLRLQSWQRSFELWQKYPILGIGYNTYRYRAAAEGIVDENYFSAGGSDSTHLTVLVATGIIGFLVFLYFYGKILLVNWLRYWRVKDERYLGFVAGGCALFVHAFFVNSLLFPLIFIPFMAIAGTLEKKANP